VTKRILLFVRMGGLPTLGRLKIKTNKIQGKKNGKKNSPNFLTWAPGTVCGRGGRGEWGGGGRGNNFYRDPSRRNSEKRGRPGERVGRHRKKRKKD